MTKLDLAHKSFVKHLKDLNRSNSTVIAYSKDIEQLTNHLLNLGVEHTHEVDHSHLKDFMTKLKDKDYTPKSISRKTNSTKTFFRYLVEQGHVSGNVADKLKHPKVESKAPRILSKLEYRALRDAAKDDVRSFAIIEVLLQTGIRISELANLKHDHVDLNSEELNLPAKRNTPKRTIPLNKAVKEAIEKYLKTRPEVKDENDSGHVFITKTGNPLLVRNIRATIKRFFKHAGVKDAKVNDLRHTFVAFHLEQGTNLLTVSKIAGHKRVSTTERYLEYIESEETGEKTELGVL